MIYIVIPLQPLHYLDYNTIYISLQSYCLYYQTNETRYVCVCIFSFSAHGTVCTFVVHEYNMTRWTFLTRLYRSQIVLSKMFTTQRMYNYSANSIPSGEWCGVLVYLKSVIVRVRCGCAVFWCQRSLYTFPILPPDPG